MKKIKFSLWMAMAALILLPVTSAFAMHHDMKGKCGYGDSLDKKVFYKAGFLLENQEAIGLSEEQVTSIKSLKLEAKKDLVAKEAQIQSLGLDIKAALDEKSIDVAAVNALVDQKYDIKKEKTKNLVQTYASLKDTLSEEQMTKAKELWKACEQEKRCWKGKSCPMGMQCPMMGGKDK